MYLRGLIPVICEDAAKVRMVCKIDAVHIPHLPLVPVGGLINNKSFTEDLNKRVNLESDLNKRVNLDSDLNKRVNLESEP